MRTQKDEMGPEPSAGYIDEVIHWVDPDADTDERFENTFSYLTRDDVINHLEKIKELDKEVREQLEKLIHRNKQLENELMRLKVENML